MATESKQKECIMIFDNQSFTMSFAQARYIGIDYREYPKVDFLPSGVTIFAVAGVWGDSVNIRCLFEDADGNRYLRNIRRWGDTGFTIKELNLDAKEILVGQSFDL